MSAQPATRLVAYAAATMDSLRTLELTLERDEARLTSKVVKLELAEVDGKPASAATYEKTKIRVGHLIVEEFETEVDVSRLKLLHSALGEPVRGQANLTNKVVKVLIFREQTK
jgi:hypothetical protein